VDADLAFGAVTVVTGGLVDWLVGWLVVGCMGGVDAVLAFGAVTVVTGGFTVTVAVTVTSAFQQRPPLRPKSSSGPNNRESRERVLVVCSTFGPNVRAC
jgi:hypothetical protein